MRGLLKDAGWLTLSNDSGDDVDLFTSRSTARVQTSRRSRRRLDPPIFPMSQAPLLAPPSQGVVRCLRTFRNRMILPLDVDISHPLLVLALALFLFVLPHPCNILLSLFHRIIEEVASCSKYYRARVATRTASGTNTL